jgi:glycosyltransferase involved in cell wall biosynthesis
LEYGVLGWPVIATDIYPYQTNNPPIVRVENTSEQWISAIRTAVSDTQSLHQSGDALKAWVHQHYILEDHLEEWVSALTE